MSFFAAAHKCVSFYMVHRHRRQPTYGDLLWQPITFFVASQFEPLASEISLSLDFGKFCIDPFSIEAKVSARQQFFREDPKFGES